jgi:hypothetical protein
LRAPKAQQKRGYIVAKINTGGCTTHNTLVLLQSG